uniref:Putative salivary protein gSG7 n=1 Tax=Anopheles stephensi TaxID=30069 RepID=Q8I6Q3_ANOST|nr:putative salivary protein gSG7 [Anopheles stephensi]
MMSSKPLWLLSALALICVIQLSTVDATPWHARQLLRYFRRIQLDKTKNSVYQDDVKVGIRRHLRAPLVQKALCLPKGTKLSSDCLYKMVDKARQHENKFYARFTYACKQHTEYSADCLESGRPLYYQALQNLVKETLKCWTL